MESDLRRWIQLVENDQEEDEDDLLGDPRVAELSRLLDIWGEAANSSTELQQKLLALRDVAAWWSDTHGTSVFYRGFMPSERQLSDLAKTGSFVIETPQDRPLASWAGDVEGAEEWITGFDHPWVIIEKPVKALQVFIDFIEASYAMNGHRPRLNEFIMIMPPQMRVTRDEIVKSGQGY